MWCSRVRCSVFFALVQQLGKMYRGDLPIYTVVKSPLLQWLKCCCCSLLGTPGHLHVQVKRPGGQFAVLANFSLSLPFWWSLVTCASCLHCQPSNACRVHVMFTGKSASELSMSC
mmetsp:Transcript_76449/g.248019  ORF Transcript_76449/g.248019 Transcript_76449/m.248019 type:complete len:115 (-) Transcript_76449:35-379(-)